MSRGVIIFIEGDTEVEIYRKFIEKLHSITNDGQFKVDKLIVRNLKGIGNFKNRAIRVFTKDILPKNSGFKFDIFLCYDSDVFDNLYAKPPVDWPEVEDSLKSAGANRVYHIEAKRSIEDWILNDMQGLCNFLKLPLTTKLNGKNGLQKIESMFKKGNKIYVKGSKIKGLVDALDIQKVMCTSCSQVKVLCRELGIKCDKQKSKM